MGTDSRKLAQDLNSILMYAAAWTKENFMKAVEQDDDQSFTLAQYKTLLMIRSKQPCKMSDISYGTRVSLASLTCMINRLEEDGVVYREYTKEDRRVVLLRLTEKGELCLQKVEEYIVNQLEDKIKAVEIDNRQDIRQAITCLVELFGKDRNA